MDKVTGFLVRTRSRIAKKLRAHIQKEKAYIKKLLFPLYLFPVKIVIYFFYYPLKISFAVTLWLIKSFFKAIFWPFRKWGNFFKTIGWALILTYLFFTFVVILDYISRNYGHYSKFFCTFKHVDLEAELSTKVVRIVGGYAQGSGFFIEEDKVLTNFHVIADEPSPKVIFTDGTFETPVKIVGDSALDIAILHLPQKHPGLVIPMVSENSFYPGESLLAVGYPLGTTLKGLPTIQKGDFFSYRSGTFNSFSYIQTDINLIEGMSGGPLVERCGKAVGVNTMGLSGLSLFIPSEVVLSNLPQFTDQEIAKITADPTTPEGAVAAFYTYLKARRMEEGFALLSSEYLKKTNFEEWTGRFRDILDVGIYLTELQDKRNNLVFVKFSTNNWVTDEIAYHYYEGTWETVLEDGVHKMNKSNIIEVINPGWEWYYTSFK